MNYRLLIYFFACIGCLAASPLFAQTGHVQGRLQIGQTQKVLPFANVALAQTNVGAIADEDGFFKLKNVPVGPYTLVVSCVGFEAKRLEIMVKENATLRLRISLDSNDHALGEVVVQGNRNTSGIERLQQKQGTAIYAGKKTEVIVMDHVNANFAVNSSRQIYAKVPGINIIENDGAGIQLSIATRGLNPNRVTEFNSRQNGYDISADPLGYPESYYTPPTEALEKIEIVRGAASLQYGSQFGGLLNFVLRKGPKNKPFEVTTRQTLGSFGLFNTFNSVGGTVGKVNYYTYFNHKQGNGWRENSGFNINTAYAQLTYNITDRLSITPEFTFMHYTMQQPGGLTDRMYAINPRASVRDRNWFSSTWNMPALSLDYRFTEDTRLNFRSFALIANRLSLGTLQPIQIADSMGRRDLMADAYHNFGSELRLIHDYKIAGRKMTILGGVRYYHGNTHRQQGDASKGSNADFKFLNPENLERSDFRFPSTNQAFFIENIFRLGEKLTITPGLRWEHIETNAQGYYKLNGQNMNDNRTNPRSFALLGVGLGYQVSENTDLYGNFSQNYAGVNFNDMRVANQNIRVDPNLQDVTGYNIDLGYRGNCNNWLSFDLGVFYMAYNNRIGLIRNYMLDSVTLVNYRTNMDDSRSLGFEAFGEIDLLRLSKIDRKWGSLALYTSAAFVDARYTNTQALYNEGMKVELAPPWILRSGLTYKSGGFSATVQWSYTAAQFTDATNTERPSTDAVTGIIPAYTLMDCSANYTYKRYTLSAGSNNLTNATYFTRRASGYPGPGILPSDGRSFYVSVKAVFGAR